MRETDADGEAGAAGVAEDVADVVVPRSGRVRLGVGAAVVLLLGALVVTVVVSAFGQQGSTTTVDAPAPSPSSAGDPSPTPGGELLVHVLGAVANPGLVTLAAGARVLDAVAAAGGLTEDADLSTVNLARPVTDGEQLAVPRVGEPLPPPPAAGSGAAASGSSASTVNLNTATQSDLETLPRIGPALASRILDWRAANGRFTSPADLLAITGIGQKLFDGLKDRVTV